ncbi:MAG: hypothetical protein ACP5G1_01945 [Nanopusillaceae archaeon]
MEDITEYEKIIENLENNLKELKEQIKKYKTSKDTLMLEFLKLKDLLGRKKELEDLIIETRNILNILSEKLEEIKTIKKKIYDLEIKVEILSKEITDIKRNMIKE